jgi:hypothetical protein
MAQVTYAGTLLPVFGAVIGLQLSPHGVEPFGLVKAKAVAARAAERIANLATIFASDVEYVLLFSEF